VEILFTTQNVFFHFRTLIKAFHVFQCVILSTYIISINHTHDYI
jgi:hypothetical protein